MKKNIQKIYPLTPMQEGMLYHALNDKSNTYFVQASYTISGNLDPEILAETIRRLSQRHDIFRTAFVYDKTERPLQIVLKNREIAFHFEDLAHKSEKYIIDFLETFREEDKANRFDLTKDALIRLAVFKTKKNQFEFILSNHHIILDGWCYSILMKELVSIYTALLKGEEPVLQPAMPYRNFISYLEKKDVREEKKHWGDYLKNYNGAAKILASYNQPLDVEAPAQRKESIVFSLEQTQRLKSIGANEKVTLNIVFQALWGITLAHYTYAQDVVFGSVVSGRPADLPEAEKMLGLFINTIPVRVSYEENTTFKNLLAKLHEESIQSLPYHHSSLATIQAAQKSKQELIHHLIAFQNYFVEGNIDEDELFHLSAFATSEQTNYDLVVDVELGEQMTIYLSYSPLAYADDHIRHIGRNIHAITLQLIDNPNLEITKLQFDDKGEWGERFLKLKSNFEQKTYWENKLNNFTSSNLPYDFDFPSNQPLEMETLEVPLLEGLWEAFKAFSEKNETSLTTCLVALFQLLIFKYTGEEELWLVSESNDQQAMHEPGNIIVKTMLEGKMSFQSLLKQTAEELAICQKQGRIPMSLEALPANYLEFEYLNVDEKKSKIEQGDYPNLFTREDISKACLFFKIEETKQQTSIIIRYSSNHFVPATVYRFADHFMLLSKAALKDSMQEIKKYTLLTDVARKELLLDFNNNFSDYPKDKTLVDLFREQAARTPNQVALIYGEKKVTYKKLEELSNQFAHYLLQDPLYQADGMIAIKLEKSNWLIVVILGVLKTGCAYIPVDVEYPEARIQYTLDDSRCALIIEEKHLNQFILSEKEYSTDPIASSSCKPDSLAYVIYTSGSTGKPKGCMIEHHNVVNCIWAQVKKYRLRENENILLLSSIVFDPFVEQMFLALLTGSILTIVDKETLLNPEQLSAQIRQHNATHLNMVPALLSLHGVEKYPSLRRVVSGGERCLPSLADKWSEYYDFYNAYGPTETTITSHSLRYNTVKSKKGKLSIGQPLLNVQTYILDDDLNLLPIGMKGEIYIGGAGLSRGYLHRPELTSERFIDHPFLDNQKLYKTGDIGRWLSDGNLEFIGRKDNQIKIRGHRVELGEIEKVLLGHDLVRNCVVVIMEGTGYNKKLIAYIEKENRYNREEVKTYLSKNLPAYMVPSHFIELEQFSLKVNGKIDKSALPPLEENSLSQATYRSPNNKLEQDLIDIWKKILKLDRIGIEDNFFEIGGHSLLATRMISGIRKQLSLELTFSDVFAYPTVVELANILKAKKTTTSAKISVQKNRPTLIPLSFSQQRLWFIDKLEGSAKYHLPAILRLSGSLNIQALESSFQELIKRHEILRTVYREEDGKAFQFVQEANNWKLSYEEKDSMIERGKLEEYFDERCSESFDLSKDYMLRAILCKTGVEEYRLIIVMHHIAADGWSIPIFVEELTKTYNATNNNQQVQLKTLDFQYADYAIWQRSLYEKNDLEKQLAYWEQQLKGTPSLDLATDFSRSLKKSYEGGTCQRQISKKTTSQLNALAQDKESTLFMVLLAAFNTLLYRYSGQDDIAVGSPIANRTQQEVEDLIGFFVNTIVLRNNLKDNPSFAELLQEVKRTTLEAYDHQDAPFEKVVDQVVDTRDMSRNPLFQVMFVMHNNPTSSELKLGNVQLAIEAYDAKVSQFEMTFNIAESPEGLDIEVTYRKDLFANDRIARMLTHFENILQGIVSNVDIRIADVPMLNKWEERQIFESFNSAALIDYPRDKTLVDIFKERAGQSPKHTAVEFGNDALTYDELDRMSDQIARQLIRKGAGPEVLVGIAMERNASMIVGILGILKSGAAYVPIDPTYPLQRIDFILDDAQLSLVVTDVASKHLFEKRTSSKTIVLDEVLKHLSDERVPAIELNLRPSNAAYVIYTSGTTGQPKGTVLEHRNVVRLFFNDDSLFDFHDRDVWTFFHSHCFDFSVWEIFGALLFGGKLIVVSRETAKDPAAFTQLLVEKKVTLLNQTPTAFKVLQNYILEASVDLNLRMLIFGGEALDLSLLKEWHQRYPYCKLINMYGITETTVHVTYKEIVAEEMDTKASLIGSPIPTLSCYVADANHNLLPVGIPGELYVGGEGVARTYLNRKKLTDERFIQNPFQPNGTRLYKSGDLVKWTTSGELEYLGRIDQQVKIRGHRIELGEIEATLQMMDVVNRSVVIARADSNGHNKLYAYVVTNESIDLPELQAHYKTHLPDYMIPAHTISIDEIPLTPNGKIDKKALPEPDQTPLSSKNFVAPQNELEVLLAKTWSDLLNRQDIGIHDNFFELGGDSIITIQVVSRMKRAGVQLKPADLFQHQTIKNIADHISNQQVIKVKAETGILAGAVGLLPIQKWFFETEFTQRSHFNQAVLFKIAKKIPVETLAILVEKIVAHHDSLRFVYSPSDEGWIQEYSDKKRELIIHEAKTIDEGSLSLEIRKCCQEYQESLAIEEGILYKFVLIKTPNEDIDNRFFIVIHHLAIDGVSWRILIEHLELGLEALLANDDVDFGIKSSSYRDWQQALMTYAETEQLNAQLPYWQQVMNNRSTLPTDKNSSISIVGDLQNYESSLNKSLTKSLLNANQAYGTEINDLLLAALAQTIVDWTGAKMVGIGLEGHGREEISPDIDLSGTVGWYTSLYPISLEVDKEIQTGDLIQSIKEQLRSIPEKGIGFGVLRYLHPSEEVRNSLAGQATEIIFNYLGQFDNVLTDDALFREANELTGNDISEDYPVRSKLEILSSIADGQLSVSWKFSGEQYFKETISQLAKEYIANLSAIIEHCSECSKVTKTPSDFGLPQEVSYKALNQFLNTTKDGLRLGDQISDLYPLSPVQEGMLFHALLDPSSKSYLEQFTFDLNEFPNTEIFQKAWNKLIHNHSILRTSFYFDQVAIPIQCVHKEIQLPFELIDLSQHPFGEQQDQLDLFLEQDRAKGFDLTRAPLMRVSLVILGDARFKMVWTHHHIISDGWSVALIMEEFLLCYETLIKGETLEEKRTDYFRDYINYIASRDQFLEKAFWTNYFEGFETLSFLPFALKDGSRNRGRGDVKSKNVLFDDARTKEIQLFARSRHLTVNTIVQGIWALLLSKYTGLSDVSYGVTVSGRPADLKQIDEKVGLFINTLPLRAKIGEKETVLDFLQKIQKSQSKTRAFQHSSLKSVQEIAGLKGDFFDSIIVFENYPIGEVLFQEWSFNVEQLEVVEQTNFMLTILVNLDDKLEVHFNYYEDLISDQSMEMIAQHFENLLNEILDQKETFVNELNILDTAEQQQLLEKFNATDVDYQKEETLVSLFENQVDLQPNQPAILFENHQLTYEELDQKANQLAHYLVENGAENGHLIGICLDRSLDMSVGLWAILKAGSCYLPIDPTYPKSRLDFIVKDAELKLIITDSQSAELFAENKNTLVIRIDQDEIFEQQSTDRLNLEIKKDDPAYVIYTSGSTGQPKGVMNLHSGIVNRLLWAQDYFNLDKNKDVVLQKTTFCFDVSVWELFWPLLVGAKLVFAEVDGQKDNYYLKSVIDAQKVTTIHFVPSMLEIFLSDITLGDCPTLRQVLCSGEALKPIHVEQFYEKFDQAELYNLYGPTEAAIDVTYWKAPADYTSQEKVFIGRPVANTKLYVLDRNAKLCPVGVPGELHIAGIQVAKEYLNRPELTTERFISDPFSADEKAKMYKTGDLVKWSMDGQLEYLGRLDHQVKIRGFRIETGEIEAVLLQSEKVDRCIVIAIDDHFHQKQLIAYIVAKETFDAAKMRDYLASQLPYYMVPAIMIELEEIPLNSSGKIDRKALPQVDFNSINRKQNVAPKTELEIALAQIWGNMLNREEISLEDDFFELGGHSLSAMRTVSAIRQQLGRDLNIQDLFTHRTISGIVGLMAKRQQVSVAKIKPVNDIIHLPLSFAQERLWFIDQLDGSENYHIPMILKVKGSLSIEGLHYSFGELVRRHEILRTVIREVDGKACQIVLPIDNWQLEESTFLDASKEAIEDFKQSTILRPFNLSEDFPFRVSLMKISAEEYMLIIVMHHIASDAWSIAIINHEFCKIYKSFVERTSLGLPALDIQYKDYARWQRENIDGLLFCDQLNYWKKQLDGVQPLDIPTDYSRPAVLSNKAEEKYIQLDEGTFNQIQSFATSEGASVFMFFISVFNALFYRYSGQEDICVGTTIAGRDNTQLEPLVGFFINTLALRNVLTENQSFRTLLLAVKQTTLDAYAHKDLPFEQVVEAVGVQRDLSRTPIYQVLFNFINVPEHEEVEIENLSIESDSNTVVTAQRDLDVNIEKTSDGLEVGITYSKDLYNEETIGQMLIHLKELIHSVLIQPDIQLDEISMINEAEKNQLLNDFNRTQVRYPSESTVLDLFERQVRQQPEKTALIFEGAKMSYLQLDKRSNQMANYLRDKNVQAQEKVGIFTERGFEMIIAIIGVLKCRAIYVPLKTDYPLNRLEYIIEDSAISKVLYADEKLLEKSGLKSPSLLKISDANSYPEIAPILEYSVSDLVYVMYTSGTTGNPKGILVNQQNILKLVYDNKDIAILPSDRVLQLSNYAFDGSTYDLYCTLLNGAELCLIKEEYVSNPEKLSLLIEEHQLTVSFMTTALFNAFVDVNIVALKGLRKLLFGGEKVSVVHVEKALEVLGANKIVHVYGPTETTVYASYHPINELTNDVVPIGKPLSNTTIYIVDKGGNPAGVGVVGEIWIGGDGVSDGYLNRPELTAQKFIADPFISGENRSVYKTGDLARFSKAGNIEFVGRKDTQVKMRGYRIELSEIEMAIKKSQLVQQSVVLTKKDSAGTLQLIAYIVQNANFTSSGLLDSLKKQLPDYMIPTAFIAIEKIPLNANGKVKKAALPEPETAVLSDKEYVEARNEIESTLVEIWKDLLERDRVGIYDDFFEIGGHSIMATRAIALIRNEFAINMPLKSLFQYTCIADLSEYITIVKQSDRRENIEEFEIIDF